MLIASSPVEIEAKAEAAGMPQDAHDAALRMFHALTDQIGQATAALGTPFDDWPNHRFYFSDKSDEMAALLQGLGARPDIIDVAQGASNPSGPPSGLYVKDSQAPYVGVLVAHENHEGYLSKFQ